MCRPEASFHHANYCETPTSNSETGKLLSMLKPKSSIAKPAQLRLHKAAAKRTRAQKVLRATFLNKVNTTTYSEESTRNAQELMSRVQAAMAADFLDKYRTTA